MTMRHFCFPEASVFFGTTQTGALYGLSDCSITYIPFVLTFRLSVARSLSYGILVVGNSWC